MHYEVILNSCLQTYDRFQVRFAKTQDIPTFLTILYHNFPALDPEHVTVQPIFEPAGSIALSQNTFPYMPDDPYLAIRRPGAVQPQKRRRVDDEDGGYDRRRFEQRHEKHGGQGDGYGRESHVSVSGDSCLLCSEIPTDSFHHQKNDHISRFPESSYAFPPALRDPLMSPEARGPVSRCVGLLEIAADFYHQKKDRIIHLPESSYAFPPPLRDRRISPEPFKRPPSVDHDGFAKPLAPAYIDTPTPANRIYHLKQLDPNQKRSDTHRAVAASPKKSTGMASVATRDPYQDGRCIPDPFWRGSAVPTEHRNARDLVTPPIRQQMSCPPYINESIESRPTGYTLPPPPDGHRTDMQHSELHGPLIGFGFAGPLGKILAPETASIAHANNATTSAKPWPTVYGRPISSGSRAGVSAVAETPGLQQTGALPQEARAGGIATSEHAYTHDQEAMHVMSTEKKREKAANQREVSLEARPVASAEDPRHPLSMRHVTTHLKANVTQSSSLYALSVEELEDAINEILVEPGFVPFVSHD